MKLAFFDDYKLGLVKDAAIVDVSAEVEGVPHTGAHDLISGLIERFDEYRPALERALRSGSTIPLASVRLRPPLPRPANIVCMANNYMEDGTRTEPPMINAFLKASTSIVGPNEVMVLPDIAAVFEGEAEIAVVIGKRAQKVSAANALEHAFGYINLIDGSARGTPPERQSFYQMKSRDTFAPIGPYLVTADEIRDPHALQIKLSVNGNVKQNFNTSDMAHKIPRCIEWISHIHTLLPGDIVATGTNHRGLNAFQDGDVVVLETEGLGKLEVTVRDDLKRTWSRDTWLERKQKNVQGEAPQLSGKYARAG